MNNTCKKDLTEAF
jgi:hypothetical protein